MIEMKSTPGWRRDYKIPGYVPYALCRRVGCNRGLSLPTASALNRLWMRTNRKPLKIRGRHEWGCIVLIPTGTKESVRSAFVDSVKRHGDTRLSPVEAYPWPSEQRPAGRVAWRLGTADFSNCKLPKAPQLQTLFAQNVTSRGKLKVLRRSVNHCVVDVPSGISLLERQRFADAVGRKVAPMGKKSRKRR